MLASFKQPPAPPPRFAFHNHPPAPPLELKTGIVTFDKSHSAQTFACFYLQWCSASYLENFWCSSFDESLRNTGLYCTKITYKKDIKKCVRGDICPLGWP